MEIIDDNPHYIVIVKFVGIYGIPPNMDDLERLLREIIPAHMIYTLEFTYMTWDVFDSLNKTWDDLDSLNLTWDEYEKWKP